MLTTKNMATCKDCNTTIEWSKRGEKWVPMDLSGSCHFDTCPARQRAKQKYENSAIDYDEMRKPKLAKGQTQLVHVPWE